MLLCHDLRIFQQEFHVLAFLLCYCKQLFLLLKVLEKPAIRVRPHELILAADISVTAFGFIENLY